MNESTEKLLSASISRLRKEAGLTQEQLAGRLGVTYQAVSKWENSLSCPDVALLPTLADIFGVTLDELFGRQSAVAMPTAAEPAPGLPWPDDNTLYAVLYQGHSLLTCQPKSSDNWENLHFIYSGPALNVSSDFPVSCDGDVYGSVTSGGDVTCGDVYGSITADGSVTCDNVSGPVSAGGNVTCDDVADSVSAGGNVTCDTISGDAAAGGSIISDDRRFGFSIHFGKGRK